MYDNGSIRETSPWTFVPTRKGSAYPLIIPLQFLPTWGGSRAVVGHVLVLAFYPIIFPSAISKIKLTYFAIADRRLCPGKNDQRQ